MDKFRNTILWLILAGWFPFLRYQRGHANVRDHETNKALADNHTMASVLQKLGYSTSVIGKWGLQGQETAPPDGRVIL